MSEVTRVDARPHPVVKILAPPSSAGVRESSGKVLPSKVPSVAAQPEVKNQKLEVANAEMGKRVQAAVAQMNEYIQSTQRDLQFSYDPDAGQTVVKVLDRSSQEVIRQIPDETFLKLAQTLAPDEPLPLFRAEA
jgi:flagellar protein FlaG